jgi:YhcN/YlaJ family sporulation lipoprotein
VIILKKYFIFLLLIAFFLSGCNSNNETDRARNDQENSNQFMNVRHSPYDDVKLEDSEKISQRLANIAGSVPNVERATAVALGKYAIVGIDVNEDLDRSKVGALKYSVAEALKKDPMGANAVVVADPDFMARIEEINEDIKNGKPVEGVLNELADIMGRIMPEVPSDLDPDVEQQMEEPKDETNNKKARELDQIQNKQSNNEKEKREHR